jgi:hypothetical protein
VSTDRLPIAITPAWRAAVARSAGRCECEDLACKHGGGWYCRAVLAEGARLFLGQDGKVRCRKCHDYVVRLAKVAAAEAAANVEIDTLF